MKHLATVLILAAAISATAPTATAQFSPASPRTTQPPPQFVSWSQLQDPGVFTTPRAESTLLQEVGYVLAMEAVFTGMSYLASRDGQYGPAIAGGFDVFIGVAGLANGSLQRTRIQKVGHYLISAAFLTKAIYNWRLNEGHGPQTRFVTNFVGFNVLVFTGYYLDTLNE